ncbi:MAG: DUF131 domain-containing protein [Candidatus Thermoplasmatota archaeon]|nr:DUF131 domain-containing protein [Candidatus Thermoplasmatota archaeon]
MYLSKRIIPPILVLFSGILFVLLGVIEGDATITLLFFIPVISGSGIYLLIGVLLIFLSFILFFVLSTVGYSSERSGKVEERRPAEKTSKKESKYGGVIFIGPIPIVFGKDKSIAKKMMYIGLGIAVVLLILYGMMILT